MASSPLDRSVPSWRRDFGLVGPVPARWAWLADAHLAAALLAALPVWCALGATVGSQLRMPAGWSAWLALVFVQPLAEELAFRGVLQGWLLRLAPTRRLGPVTLANLGTTAAFVAWHVGTQPFLWALAVAIPSLVFGHLRERLGSVWPAVIVHIVYNAGFGLTAWWLRA